MMKKPADFDISDIKADGCPPCPPPPPLSPGLNVLHICPNGHYYAGGEEGACPYCGQAAKDGGVPLTGKGTEALPPPLPQGALIGGKYRLSGETPKRTEGAARYPAQNIHSGETVQIVEYTGRPGTGVLDASSRDRFLAGYPQAIDSFMQNGTVYAVLEYDPSEDEEPESSAPYDRGLTPTVSIEPEAVAPEPEPYEPPEPVLFMPDLDPDLAPAQPKPEQSRRLRIVDPELVCRKCMHVSVSPFNRCPSCGEWADPRPSERARSGGLPLRTFLAGRFMVGNRLFCGAELHVYAGWDMYESRPVEIIEYFPKRLARRMPDGFLLEAADMAAFEAGAERFLSCGALYRRFGGEYGVPEFAGCFYENGTAYLAAFLEEGLTLAALASRGGMSHSVLTPILRGAVQAVKALHLQGGAHAGLSPETIFVTASGEARLLVPYGDTSPAPEPGTPTHIYGYKAPELAEWQELSPRCDVYSLALTAYAVLEGADPERDLAFGLFLSGQGELDLMRLQDERAAELIGRCLRAPDERPRDPEEFLTLFGELY